MSRHAVSLHPALRNQTSVLRLRLRYTPLLMAASDADLFHRALPDFSQSLVPTSLMPRREVYTCDSLYVSQVEGTSRTRFFVAARGDTDEAGRAELAMARDVVLLKSEQTYRTISAATLAVFQHAVTEYDFAFVLKVGSPPHPSSPPRPPHPPRARLEHVHTGRCRCSPGHAFPNSKLQSARMRTKRALPRSKTGMLSSTSLEPVSQARLF